MAALEPFLKSEDWERLFFYSVALQKSPLQSPGFGGVSAPDAGCDANRSML